MKQGARWRTALGKTTSLVASAALAMSMVVAAPGGIAQAADADAQAADLTIGNAAQLRDFAKAVNEGQSFVGKTVALTSDLDLGGSDFTPIGTKAHPFCGTFEGGGSEISGLKVAGTEYVGLFGYIGAGGSVRDLELDDDCTIVAQSGTAVVRNVGSIAGYVYGAPTSGTVSAGTASGSTVTAIQNCTSAATVTVTSTLNGAKAKVGKSQAPDASLASNTLDEGNAIEYVGGLVGFSAGGIAESEFSGKLTVTTHANPATDLPAVARSVGGVAGQVGGYTIERASGSTVSYEPFYPGADGSFSSKAAAVTVSNTANTGTVTTVVDGDGGKDRFGEAVSAKLQGVGGVAGTALASFASCENAGNVDSPSGDGAGGIVGNLRGIVVTGFTSAGSDAGCYKAPGAAESTRMQGPLLEVSRSTNDAQVTGLHAAGGIVGCAGTYTRITNDSNVYTSAVRPGVTGTRWNKPTSGGILGQGFGKVDHCYSRAMVSTKTGSGFYVAGVAGTLARWQKDDGADLDSPVPELSSCYATGKVDAGKSYKAGALVGENSGYVHDCYYLEGIDPDGKAVADDHATTADENLMGDRATVKAVASSDDLKAKSGVALLNAPTTVAEYQTGTYFVPAQDADENDGYPVLSWERDAGTKSIGTPSFSGTGQAAYSAAENPVPKLSAQGLVQGADYYVLPDAAALGGNGVCKDVSALAGTTLHAKIVGIGDYASDPAGVGDAPYTVAKGDFSTCTVRIDKVTYDAAAHYPGKDGVAVQVTDASGAIVPADSYSFAPSNWTGECVNHHVTYVRYSAAGIKTQREGYEFKFTPKAGSNYESGTAAFGYFIIDKANLADATNFSYGAIKVGKQTWYYKLGAIGAGGMTEGYVYHKVNGKEVRGMSVPFTGASIKPTIASVNFKEAGGKTRALKSGTEYRLVYGDPGAASDGGTADADSATPNRNVTGSKVGTRACVTVRSIPGDTSNFTNYQNIYFDITKASVKKLKVSKKVTYKKGKKAIPTVTLNGHKLVAGKDFKATYKNNKKPGTAKITLKGYKNTSGKVTRTFKVVKK